MCFNGKVVINICGHQSNVESASKKVVRAVDSIRDTNSGASGSGKATLTFSQFKACKEENRKGYFSRKRPKRANLVMNLMSTLM